LQYAIVQKAGNDSAKAPLTNVVLKAGMPPFSTYVPGSTTVNAASLDDVGDPAQSQVFYGVMVQSPGSAAGNIATNDRAEVIFMVKMDESSGGNGALSNASIQWETDPDRVTFTWTVTGLSSEYEYWVYPHVGFTENGGPFGSTPEDEANDLKGMYSMATPGYRPAEDGAGSWNYYGGKPTNPSGRLALLAYDASSGNAWVVDISEEINIDAW
jgi:hypothetical protein